MATLDFTIRTEKGDKLKGGGCPLPLAIEMIFHNCTKEEKCLVTEKLNELLDQQD